MIRVLQVIEATIGGTRRHLSQLVHQLGGHGIEVTVVCSVLRTEDFRRDIATMMANGVEVIEIPMARNIQPTADLQALRAIKRVIRRVRFDVVHTHSSKAGALGRSACGGNGPALVHTPHSFAFLHDAEFSPIKRRIYLLVERRLGRRTTRLVAVCQSEADAAVSHRIVPQNRVSVINNGIEPNLAPSRPRKELRAELGLACDDPVVISMGLLELSKGHRYLIEAVGHAINNIPNLRCLIVGDGSLRNELEDQSRRAGLTGHIIFTGHRRDAFNLIAASDSLILPSLWEGLPYVILEAMALGRPVISTRVGGCGELVDHGATGLLVASKDPQALAGAICKLLKSPEVGADMGRRGRDRVRASFSVDTMISSHARMYAEVM